MKLSPERFIKAPGIFEFVNQEGFTLCGGGRYDGLIHEIDEKQDIPSVASSPAPVVFAGLT